MAGHFSVSANGRLTVRAPPGPGGTRDLERSPSIPSWQEDARAMESKWSVHANVVQSRTLPGPMLHCLNRPTFPRRAATEGWLGPKQCGIRRQNGIRSTRPLMSRSRAAIRRPGPQRRHLEIRREKVWIPTARNFISASSIAHRRSSPESGSGRETF